MTRAACDCEAWAAQAPLARCNFASLHAGVLSRTKEMIGTRSSLRDAAFWAAQEHKEADLLPEFCALQIPTDSISDLVSLAKK